MNDLLFYIVAIFSIAGFTWPIYLIGAVPLSAPIWYFTIKNVHWSVHELHLFWLPHLAWSILMISFEGRKSLTNIYDSFWVGLTIPTVLMVKIILDIWLDIELKLKWTLPICIVSAIFIWYIIPALPE